MSWTEIQFVILGVCGIIAAHVLMNPVCIHAETQETFLHHFTAQASSVKVKLGHRVRSLQRKSAI